MHRSAQSWLLATILLPILIFGVSGCSEDCDHPVVPDDGGGEVLSESISITTQEQLEELSNVERAYGHIRIEGTEVHDLSPLSNLEYCQSLLIAGTGITTLQGLEKLEIVQVQLSLHDNRTLRDVDALSGLTRAGRIEITRNHLLTNLDAIHHISLMSLLIEDLPEVATLGTLDAIEGLQTLSIYSCTNLTQLPPPAVLTTLNALNLRQLPVLSPGATMTGEFPLLRELKLEDLPLIEDLTGFGELPELWHLSLNNLNSLVSLAGLGRLDNLEVLYLMDLEGLASVAGLPAMPNLVRVRIIDCQGLQSLSGFPDLPQLDTLDLYQLSLASLEGLPSMPNLRYLTIDLIHQLTSLSGLPSLPNLVNLRIRRCDAIDNLAGLTDSTVPWQLDVSYCPINSFGSDVDLPNCESLVLMECQQLETFAGFEVMTGITRLRVNGCDQLRNFSGINCPEIMESIDLEGNGDLESFDGLQGLRHLTQHLQISNHATLATLSGFDNLETIQDIRITDNLSLPQATIIDFMAGLDSWDTAVIGGNGP